MRKKISRDLPRAKHSSRRTVSRALRNSSKILKYFSYDSFIILIRLLCDLLKLHYRYKPEKCFYREAIAFRERLNDLVELNRVGAQSSAHRRSNFDTRDPKG